MINTTVQPSYRLALLRLTQVESTQMFTLIGGGCHANSTF